MVVVFNFNEIPPNLFGNTGLGICEDGGLPRVTCLYFSESRDDRKVGHACKLPSILFL